MEAAQKLEQGFIQTIRVRVLDIKWTEPGEEILIEGKLFDVKEYSLDHESFVVKGIFDTAETLVRNQLNDFLNNHYHKRNSVLLKCLQFQSHIYFQQITTSFFFVENPASDFGDLLIFSQSDISIGNPTPPPEA